MSMLMLGVGVFSCSLTTGWVLASLYLMCVALGMLSPMSTSHGMLVIDKNHGAAAALFTFAFALISGVWSLVRAWTTLSPHAFIALAVLISWLAMAGLLLIRK